MSVSCCHLVFWQSADECYRFVDDFFKSTSRSTGMVLVKPDIQEAVESSRLVFKIDTRQTCPQSLLYDSSSITARALQLGP